MRTCQFQQELRQQHQHDQLPRAGKSRSGRIKQGTISRRHSMHDLAVALEDDTLTRAR